MSLFDIFRRFNPVARPESSHAPQSLDTDATPSADPTMTPVTQNPPSYQAVMTPKVWKVEVWLGSDPKLLRQATPMVDLTVGWDAYLELSTTDIIGLMQEGLYVSQDNVNVQESYLTARHCHKEQKYYYDRQFVLAGPSWTGRLVVSTLRQPVATNFPIEHLSVDKVHQARAWDVSKRPNLVYLFLLNNPIYNANYILDDTSLEGLWPWPREEQRTLGKKKDGGKAKEEVGESEMPVLL
ncbi:hypothetical protein IL306_015049 [Fusarium sp. DS 682]|nr:hypothetical protein IL306_015049 [Fusarium sp. DS 682]